MSRIVLPIVAAILVASLCSRADDAPKPTLIDEAPAELRNVAPRLWEVKFSPDGTRLATTSGWKTPAFFGPDPEGVVEPGELVIWDVATRRELLVLRQYATIRTAAFSPDGKRMIMGDFAGKLRLIETATGKTLWKIDAHAELVNSVAFVDKDTVVSGGFDGEIHVRDAETGKLKKSVSVGGDRIVTLDLPADRKLVGAVTWNGSALVERVNG